MNDFLKIMAGALAITAFAATNASCSKDEEEEPRNGTLTVTVKDGAYLAGFTVKLLVPTGKGTALAMTTCGDNGFVLRFPENVDDSLLEGAGKMFRDLTGPDMKGTTGYLMAYDGETYANDFLNGIGEWPGELVYFQNGAKEWPGELFYVDRDVKITGTYHSVAYGDEVYDVQLKRGWNMVYKGWRTPYMMYTFGAYEITDRAPEGARWYFIRHVRPIPQDSAVK
jgi:hypothetical protein